MDTWDTYAYIIIYIDEYCTFLFIVCHCHVDVTKCTFFHISRGYVSLYQNKPISLHRDYYLHVRLNTQAKMTHTELKNLINEAKVVTTPDGKSVKVTAVTTNDNRKKLYTIEVDGTPMTDMSRAKVSTLLEGRSIRTLSSKKGEKVVVIESEDDYINLRVLRATEGLTSALTFATNDDMRRQLESMIVMQTAIVTEQARKDFADRDAARRDLAVAIESYGELKKDILKLAKQDSWREVAAHIDGLCAALASIEVLRAKL